MPHAAGLVIALVLMLQTSAKPFVFGNAVARVTDDDLSTIARVAGEPIWLLTIGGQPTPI
jgi:hypothetical protein